MYFHQHHKDEPETWIVSIVETRRRTCLVEASSEGEALDRYLADEILEDSTQLVDCEIEQPRPQSSVPTPAKELRQALATIGNSS